jgi:DNA damage-binding protein 1
VIAKSRRLEIRQLQSSDASETSEDPAVNSSSPFPVVFSVPINGRITSLEAFTIPSSPTSFLFLTTDQQQYAVISYDEKATPYPVETHASGSLEGDELFILGKLAECGPLVSVDPHHRCIVLHLYDGLLTIFPIQQSYQPPSKRQQQQKGTGMSTTFSSRSAILGAPFHARLEERTLLGITMLHHADPSATIPHVCVLHQDARGAQHITTHAIDLGRAQLVNLSSSSSNVASSAGGPPNNCERLKKSKVDGGSSLILSVPPPQPLVASAATAANSNAAPVHRPSGGVVILGQRQITYCAMNGYKVMPIPPALLLSWDVLPPDASGMPRFLLGDEFGNLHMLTLITQDGTVIALQLDTLGSCTLSSKLLYLDAGIVFCGSILGDSQLIQIHDEPIPVEQHDDMDDALELDDTTYLSVIEEYTNLGPIVDFDLVPTTPGGGSKGAESGGLGQSQVVTASGTSKSGSLRVIRNGIGMNEYASIELGGIQNMWSLRHDFDDAHHTYLVQSYVGQTRVLGVTSSSGEDDVQMEGADDEDDEEVGGTLEEAVLPGLESNESTLYVGNVVGNLYVQITEQKLRLSTPAGDVLDTWTHPEGSNITVGVGNESGQIAIALRGGIVVYFEIQDNKLIKCQEKQMDKEVSCMNINPFTPLPSSMQTDGNATNKSSVLAAGLWDDFTVRLLSLEDQLVELAQIHLSTKEEEEMEEASAANDQRRNRNNMMARSLCLITLDFAASHSLDGHSSRSNMNNSSPGVNMLFVGLGDGTLVSFAVVEPGDGRALTVQSKKEVSLGTQRINLVPLKTEKGGTCVLATGDRPTVIYLTGVGGTSTSNFNPKLCYSNVNLSAEEEEEGDISNDVSRPHSQQSIAVNVAASFFSPLLFDAMGSENYSLCVADDTNLRLGVIDDIQKLHVTTCRLGMAPRRIVHYAEGRMFAVGCIESGIKQAGMGGGEMNMGNCIRFLDDTTFDDVER